MLGVISNIVSIVAWIVGILVLIKLFKKEGVLKGILGIICMLYTFIWGWMHHKEEGITTIMWVWTAIIIVSMVFGGVVASSIASSAAGSSYLSLFI
ncbi:MAG: hypothetical protein WCI88_06050 [Chloroflexota bacterium]